MTTDFTSTADHDRSEWFKSSYSNAGGSCVEARFVSGAAFVRDSKDRRADSPVIALSPTAWTSFLDTVTPTDA